MEEHPGDVITQRRWFTAGGGFVGLQTQFLKFHDAIKLDNYDENATLRDKRDRILARLREGFASRPVGERWTFEPFNQGSYAMSTGVIPVDGDYDIDVGVVFNGDPTQLDPLFVKGRVFEIVQPHTSRVVWQRPCITVHYQNQGELIYHVDLPIYLKDSRGQLHLALGKQHSSAPHKRWEVQDPKGLIQKVQEKHSGEDRNQFRRVVRYLKRWKGHNFPSNGKAAPVGIGLTLCALQGFSPTRKSNWVYGYGTPVSSADYDDLAVTLALVQWIRGQFRQVWSGGQVVNRLKIQTPVQPFDDVFERMTDQQMLEFYQRLGTLEDNLKEAQRTDSSAPLVKVFGSDFPSR